MSKRSKRGADSIEADASTGVLTSLWRAQKARRTPPSNADLKSAAMATVASSTALVTSAALVSSSTKTLAAAYAAAAASAATKPVSKFKPRPIPKVDHHVPVVNGG